MIFEVLEGIDDFPIEWVHFGEGDQFEELRELVNKNTNSKLKVVLKGHTSNHLVQKHYAEQPVDSFH